MSAEQKVQKTKANGITEGSIFGQLLLFSSLFYSEPFFSSFIIRQMLW